MVDPSHLTLLQGCAFTLTAKKKEVLDESRFFSDFPSPMVLLCPIPGFEVESVLVTLPRVYVGTVDDWTALKTTNLMACLVGVATSLIVRTFINSRSKLFYSSCAFLYFVVGVLVLTTVVIW